MNKLADKAIFDMSENFNINEYSNKRKFDDQIDKYNSKNSLSGKGFPNR